MALTNKSMNSKKLGFTIVTSWDDGGKQDLRIAKLLKKHKLLGVFYIVTDWVGKEGFMTWDDIKSLDEQGFRIGSHTITHPMDLKKLHDEDLLLEIQTSKEMIETVLGHPIIDFCYPRGRADERVKRVVANAGYIEARTTGRTGVITAEDELFLPGSIHVLQREEYKGKPIFEYAREVINQTVLKGGYCNIWGHSAEIEKNNLWEVLDQVLRYASTRIRRV